MSAEQANLWDGLVQMGKELKRTHAAGLLSAAFWSGAGLDWSVGSAVDASLSF